MKRNMKYILAAMVVGLSFQACDFLDLEPKILSPETFYNTENDVKYGLAGVYGALNNEETYGNYYSLMISGVDDLCYYNRDESIAPYFYNYGTTDNHVYQCWSMLYAGIKNANEFMDGIEAVRDKLDPDLRYYSEARFLRAYYHFLLAQAWGNVPLRTVAVKSPDAVQLAATPQADVLRWCVREMEDCIEYIPEGMTGAPSRISRSAIQGILARAYLFMAGESVTGFDSKAMYAQAAHWAWQVIDSKLHTLNPDYSKVFINMIGDVYDTQYRESIWEVDFLGDRTSDDKWTNGRIGDLIGMQNTATDNEYGKWACNYAYGMYNGSLSLWDLYWTNDRTDDEDALPNEIKDKRQAWNMAEYNYSGNTSNGNNFKAGYDKTPYFYESKSSIEFPISAAGQRNCTKWRREVIYEKQMTAKNLYTTINFPILRYSDVLLMYAEAINESESDTGTAYQYVEMVRERAGIKTRDLSEYSDQDAMRKLIRNERGRELCFEALRKYDLIRWGTFVQYMKKYTEWQSDERWSKNAMSVRASVIGKNIQPKHVYLPIPATELGVNKLLKQNPLW